MSLGLAGGYVYIRLLNFVLSGFIPYGFPQTSHSLARRQTDWQVRFFLPSLCYMRVNILIHLKKTFWFQNFNHHLKESCSIRNSVSLRCILADKLTKSDNNLEQFCTYLSCKFTPCIRHYTVSAWYDNFHL